MTETPVVLLCSASAAQAGRHVGRRAYMQETAADVKNVYLLLWGSLLPEGTEFGQLCHDVPVRFLKWISKNKLFPGSYKWFACFFGFFFSPV